MLRGISIWVNSLAALCFLTVYAVADELGKPLQVPVTVHVVDMVEVDDYCAQDPMPEGCVLITPEELNETDAAGGE